ncbi:hypothetical protein Mapa_015413 [Marchantia paleacea]|nr:hypothetical protein Mapa_015413 [Marchantia paleacea]
MVTTNCQAKCFTDKAATYVHPPQTKKLETTRLRTPSNSNFCRSSRRRCLELRRLLYGHVPSSRRKPCLGSDKRCLPLAGLPSRIPSINSNALRFPYALQWAQSGGHRNETYAPASWPCCSEGSTAAC